MAELLPWLIAAALIIGIGKGGFPVAAALAVPFLALVMNPVQAAALVLPVLNVADCAAIWLYRRHYSRRNLAILLPAMGLGLVIATLIVPNASEPLLLAFTGCAGLWTVWRQWFVSSPVTTRNAGIASGAFWGIVAGITSFLTHSGAPATQAYLLPQRLPKLILTGTMAITFAIVNFAKIPSYNALGFFDGLNWPLAAGLAGVGILGALLGRLLIRMPEPLYMRIIEILLLALSLILIFKAARGFAGA